MLNKTLFEKIGIRFGSRFGLSGMALALAVVSAGVTAKDVSVAEAISYGVTDQLQAVQANVYQELMQNFYVSLYASLDNASQGSDFNQEASGTVITIQDVKSEDEE